MIRLQTLIERVELTPEGNLKISDINDITQSQWEKINRIMVQKGYNMRGPDDCKRAILKFLENPNNETPDVIPQETMPVEGSELLTDEQLRMEALMLGLRTRRGVALELALTFPHASATLQKLQADGLLIMSNNRLAPTTHGLLLADSLALRFLE